jgi:hypothetical protein
MPGAGHMRARIDGGPLKGGAPRVVWQALDADPRTVPAGLAAQRLDQLGRASHLVWNPVSGEVVQLIPILRAGRSLGWPDGLKSGALPAPDASAIWRPARQAAAETAARGTEVDAIAEVNAEGRLCVQIGVVAFAWDPFTSRPMAGLQQILDWLDSWGIPRQWPAGQPAAFPDEQAACRNRRLWARGGHFGASQVPGLTAVGPGAVDVELLTGWTGPGRRYAGVGQARHADVRGADVRGADVALPDACDDGAGSEMRDLDGYFGRDDVAARAGALSRVG